MIITIYKQRLAISEMYCTESLLDRTMSMQSYVKFAVKV